jgi:SnoaL-like domain
MAIAVDTGPAAIRTRMREAMESHDHAAVVALLAPDVVLRSPIIGTPFEGREAVGRLLGAVIAEFGDSVYTGEGEVGDRQVLHASARVRGLDIDIVDSMHVNDDGLVDHIKVYIRPIAGLAAVAAALGPHLAKSRVHGLLITAAAIPFALLTRLMQTVSPRLIRVRSGA